MTIVGSVAYLARGKLTVKGRKPSVSSAFSLAPASLVPAREADVSTAAPSVGPIQAPSLLALQETVAERTPPAEVIAWGENALAALKKLQLSCLRGDAGAGPLLAELEQICGSIPHCETAGLRGVINSIQVRIVTETAKARRREATRKRLLEKDEAFDSE